MAMGALFVGLILFLGSHSTRMLVPDWREAQLNRQGEKRWKGVIALLSLLGFAFLVPGYTFAHGDQDTLWQAPVWLEAVSGTLMLIALVIAAAAFIPGNQIQRWLGHPLVAAVGLWALAHLLSTGGRPADLALFGLFLIWAASDLVSLRRRDRATGVVYPAGRLTMDGAAIGAGLAVYLIFVAFLHDFLFGVPAFG